MRSRVALWISLLLCTVAAVEPLSASCDGAETTIYWSSYQDDWLVSDSFYPGGPQIGEVGWYSPIDETVEIGDCPPSCSYTTHTIASFFGGNEWFSDIGGQGRIFRQLASGQGGTAIGLDSNGNVLSFDGVDQVWKTIPGSFDSTATITAGDSGHVYVLQSDGVYHLNSSGSWDQVTGPSGIVEISVTSDGYLLGRDTWGQLYLWHGYWDSSSYPSLSGMSQFSSSHYDIGNVAGPFSPGVFAISNGAIYFMVYGTPWHWAYLATPFTPVEIRSGENSTVALASNGNLYTLTSLSPADGNWTSMTAQWTFTAAAPAGVTHLTTGTASDIYAYGASTTVQRFYPNSTVETLAGDYGYDSTYGSANLLSLIPSNVPEDFLPQISGESSVTSSCGGATVLAAAFSLQIKLAYTKSIVDYSIPPQQQPDGSKRCFEQTWCTPNTTPPICNPTYVDQQPPVVGQETTSCFPYYNSNWLAERTSSSSAWVCIPLIPGQNAVGTMDASRAACTK